MPTRAAGCPSAPPCPTSRTRRCQGTPAAVSCRRCGEPAQTSSWVRPSSAPYGVEVESSDLGPLSAPAGAVCIRPCLPVLLPGRLAAGKGTAGRHPDRALEPSLDPEVVNTDVSTRSRVTDDPRDRCPPRLQARNGRRHGAVSVASSGLGPQSGQASVAARVKRAARSRRAAQSSAATTEAATRALPTPTPTAPAAA